MKANELRIGNRLQKDNGEIFTVLRVDNTQDVLVEEQRGLLTLGYNLLGIRLTGEHLLKLGFTKDDEYPMYYKSGFTLSLSDEGYSLHINLEYMLVKKIEYVHKLQNLWYELTGEELTFNQ